MIRRPDRRGLARFLASLDLTPPLVLDHFVARLAVRRGRPLRLLPHPIEVPGPFGCWIATRTCDYVVYQQATTAAHQAHIVLHEIGHILAGHGRPEIREPVPAGRVHPELERAAVDRVLYRNSYSDRHEYEAESIATLLTAWSAPLTVLADDDGGGLLGRLEASMRGSHWR